MLRARFEDTQTLNTPTIVRGMPVLVRVRWIKGDLPLLQRSLGIHSSGSARFRCPLCEAGHEMCAAQTHSACWPAYLPPSKHSFFSIQEQLPNDRAAVCNKSISSCHVYSRTPNHPTALPAYHPQCTKPPTPTQESQLPRRCACSLHLSAHAQWPPSRIPTPRPLRELTHLRVCAHRKPWSSSHR